MKTIYLSHYKSVPENFSGLVVYPDEEKRWFQNGILHREDGPAILYPDGGKYWYQYDSLHRLDGPAIDYSNGNFEWWQKGKRHRLDGPAVEWHNGERDYWILDKELTEDEFEIFQTMWKQTLLERTDELIETFVKLAKMK